MGYISPMTDPKALFVKNLPPLPSGKFEELLSHYKCVDSVALAQGSIAILRFETIADANKARASLHNARILDSVLEVRSYVPKSIQQPSIKTETSAEPEPTPSFTGHPIASKLGFHYPPNPHLEYVYPPPNEDILCNILNAIDNCPKLYTQVLHLMNKMNLPPPFRPSSATPLSIDYQSIRNKVKKKEKAKHDDLLSSDESEISDVESEHRVEPRKRPPIVPSELLHPTSKRKKTEEPIPPFSKPPVAPPQPVHQLHHIHIHSNNAPAPDPPSIDSGVTEPQEEKHEEISVVKEKVQDRWNESGTIIYVELQLAEGVTKRFMQRFWSGFQITKKELRPPSCILRILQNM